MKLDKETAIVLLEAGEPAGPGDVNVFLRQFLTDKETNPLPLIKKPFRRLVVETVLAQEAEEYQREFAEIGVDSPLHRVCGGQANGIAEILGCEGYVAMNHGMPSIEMIVKLMIEEGMKRAVVVPMDPHEANHSTRAAVENFRRTWQQAGFAADSIKVVDRWSQDPQVVKACADHYAETLSLVPNGSQVIFVAKDPGTNALRADANYEGKVRQTCKDLSALLDSSVTPEIGWLAARCTEGSLQPQIGELIESTATDGATAIALVPFGWVADRFETLCSIDMKCGRLVRQQKLRLFRVPTINDRPEFLVSIARHIARESQEAAA